jgi:hypothetical protein
VGRGSSVGIATSYELDGPGIKSRWGRDFPHLSRPALGALPASCTMGTGFFRGVKSGRGVRLTPHPLLVPWSWKGTVIPLLPFWAVRPVDSLSANTRMHFTCVTSTNIRRPLRFMSVRHAVTRGATYIDIMNKCILSQLVCTADTRCTFQVVPIHFTCYLE